MKWIEEAQRRRADSINKLKIAIYCAGGDPNTVLKQIEKPLGDLLDTLWPNGINLAFQLTGYFPKSRRKKFERLCLKYHEEKIEDGFDINDLFI